MIYFTLTTFSIFGRRQHVHESCCGDHNNDDLEDLSKFYGKCSCDPLIKSTKSTEAPFVHLDIVLNDYLTLAKAPSLIHKRVKIKRDKRSIETLLSKKCVVESDRKAPKKRN